MIYGFNTFLLLLLVAPIVSLLCVKMKKARALSPIVLVVALLTGAATTGVSFWRGDRLSLDLSRLTPLPFALTVDRLSAFFLLLICAVSVPVVLYSASYIERHYEGLRRDGLWILLPAFIASMVLVVTASTGFAFLFGWELMTLLSAGLIMMEGDAGQRRHNIFIYLLMMHVGAAAVIGAFLLFLPHAPGLTFAAMRTVAAQMPQGMRTAIFLLAFLGFGTKAGIVPLHLWLPRAHPIAPSPVSALMSAVMLKTAVYAFVRFGFDFLGTGPAWWGYLVLAAGAVSGVLGVLYALAENDIKRLLAYSSVENIGIIFMAIGAAMVLRAYGAPSLAALALLAALLHAINHALFKSTLFLGAGSVSDATHTLNMEELGGLLNRMPVTGIAMLVACCSIIGLPLFNGFVGEWLAFRAFLGGSTLPPIAPAIVLPLVAGVLALIGGVAAACFAKLYGVVFLSRPRSEKAEHAREVPVLMQLGVALPAAACVLIGVFPAIVLWPLMTTISELMPGTAMPAQATSIATVLPWLALAVIAIVAVVALVRRTVRVTATWACGQPGLDARMQYSGTALSKPLRKVFSQVYRPDRAVNISPAGQPYFPETISYRSVRTTSFERALYRPAVDAVVAAAHRLRRLQTGNIQVYLLYLFLALVSLLLFMRFL